MSSDQPTHHDPLDADELDPRVPAPAPATEGDTVTPTNQQWRIVFGAIAVVCSFLLIQPQVNDVPWLAIALGAVNALVAFLKAPDEAA